MSTTHFTTSIQPCSPQGRFANEPFTDFKAPENARAMQAALDTVATQLGREYDLIIGGQRIKTADKIRSINPARPAQVGAGSSLYSAIWATVCWSTCLMWATTA